LVNFYIYLFIYRCMASVRSESEGRGLPIPVLEEPASTVSIVVRGRNSAACIK